MTATTTMASDSTQQRLLVGGGGWRRTPSVGVLPARFVRGLTRVLLAVVALLATGCAGDGADDIQAQAGDSGAGAAQYPDWLQKVYPPPGSETSATQAVQVNHSVVAHDREVRLTIDDTDVTTYATATSPGLLEYDIDQEAAPVDLGPANTRPLSSCTGPPPAQARAPRASTKMCAR